MSLFWCEFCCCRSPVISEWEKSLKQSKYAQDDFLIDLWVCKVTYIIHCACLIWYIAVWLSSQQLAVYSMWVGECFELYVIVFVSYKHLLSHTLASIYRIHECLSTFSLKRNLFAAILFANGTSCDDTYIGTAKPNGQTLNVMIVVVTNTFIKLEVYIPVN